MQRLSIVLIQVVVAALLLQGCNRSLMPEGFEKVKIGEPIEQLLDFVAKEPTLSSTLDLKTPLLAPERHWHPTGSADQTLQEMKRARDEYKQFLKSIEGANPFAHASDVDDIDYFTLVVGPSHGFSHIDFEFSKSAGSGVVLKRVTFSLTERSIALHQDLVAQARRKIGRAGKMESDDRNGCHEDSASWLVCDQGVEYEVNRWDCADHSGGIDVKLAQPYQTECESKNTLQL